MIEKEKEPKFSCKKCYHYFGCEHKGKQDQDCKNQKFAPVKHKEWEGC
jgi:predicted nucleic acid binding AN1-type Zn finger protein